MPKTKFIFRLNGKTDKDLILLYQQVGSQIFNKIIRDALRTAIRTYYSPEYKLNVNYKRMPIDNKTQIRIDIEFSPKDNDVLLLLSKIEERKTNVFVKLALRFYLGRSYCLKNLLDISNIQIEEIKNIQVLQISNSLQKEQETMPIKIPQKQKQKQKQKSKPKPKQKHISTEKTKEQEPIPQIKTTHMEIPNETHEIELAENDDILDLLENLLN